MNKFEQTLPMELLRAMDHLGKAWRCTSPRPNLNKSSFFTLMTLRKYGVRQEQTGGLPAMTISELAKTMEQTNPTVSQRVAKLEEKGYVQRIQDKEDRRTVWVQLTQQGDQLVEQTSSQVHNRMQQVIDKMEQQHHASVQQLIRLIHLMADLMEQEFSNTEYGTKNFEKGEKPLC